MSQKSRFSERDFVSQSRRLRTMTDLQGKVTGVIINFQTPGFTRKAVESLRQFYPHLPLLLVDNGSEDNSRSMLLLHRVGL